MSVSLLRRSAATGAVRAASSLTVGSQAGASLAFTRGKATLPDLPYAYDALEPAISAQIMHLHHAKHHQAYVTGYNDVSARLTTALQHMPDSTSTSTFATAASAAASVAALQPLLAFHAGGHANHSLFWENLAPAGRGGGGAPEGALATAVEATFGGLDTLKELFATRLAGVRGSGWAWLVQDEGTGGLSVRTYENQDPVVTPFKPILGIDAWEHAYYTLDTVRLLIRRGLQYENRKAEYFKAIWDVINWKVAEKRFK